MGSYKLGVCINANKNVNCLLSTVPRFPRFPAFVLVRAPLDEAEYGVLVEWYYQRIQLKYWEKSLAQCYFLPRQFSHGLSWDRTRAFTRGPLYAKANVLGSR